MNRTALLERITIDPNVCFGKPYVRGTRICGRPDTDVLAAAVREVRVLVTLDLGFADTLRFRPRDATGIVVVGRVRVHQDPDDPDLPDEDGEETAGAEEFPPPNSPSP